MAGLCLTTVTSVAVATAASAPETLTVTALKTEYRVDPIGIDATRPRFSWQLTSDARAQMQRAYQVLVSSSPANLDAGVGDKWDSGQIVSDRSNQIEYRGSEVAARARYYWKVRVWDANNLVSTWSSDASFELGLLSSADWTARWIAEPAVTARSPLLRKRFVVDKPVRRARVYATALGVYELQLNGQRVGEDYFAPGWTAYAKRLEYQTYDVTGLIVSGPNAVGAILGDGWYAARGVIRTPVADTSRAVRVQLEIEYADGSREHVDSDASWRAWIDGPIRSSGLEEGEVYDARKDLPGWSTGRFDDSAWTRAREVASYAGMLVAAGVPVRVMQDQPSVAIGTPDAGVYVFDLGQILSGWAHLRVQGPAGTKVRLRFGEALKPDGALDAESGRAAAPGDVFVLRGTGKTEIFEPHFTYHRFRYVEVTGFPGRPGLSAVTGRVAYAALDPTGTLTTSSPPLNQLYAAIVWSQRDCFQAVPSDSRERDQRMGDTGAGQVFAAAAALNMDVAAYFSKWSRDIEDEQLGSGAYTVTAPVGSRPLPPSSGWQEAGVIIPWTVYRTYGDTRLIDRRWPSMVRFVEYLRAHATNNLLPAELSVYGDPGAIGEVVPREIVANTYYGHSVKLMAEMARATKRNAEADRYDALFSAIRDAFAKAYVTPDGQVTGGSETGYALAIGLDMLPEARVAGAANYLVSDIRSRANFLATGLLGTRDLHRALSESGHTSVAYDLIQQTNAPSWLFTIERGATTVPGRWDDQSFSASYGLGSVGAWLFGTVAGIEGDPQKPGYKGIVIRPRPGGGLTYARGEYRSIQGPIMSEWRLTGSTFRLNVSIPANTTATVYVPTRDLSTVTEGGAPIDSVAGVTFLRMTADSALYAVDSGHYTFASDLTGTGPGPAPTPAPGGFTFCTNEAVSPCTFTGVRQVRFGANATYAYGTFAGSVPCTNGVFGDPVPGVLKHCDYSNVGQPTPWWTRGRLTAVLATMSTLLLAGLAWVWSLRRTVKRQTEVIRDKLAREAVLSERTRIARELHDGMAQTIAAVSIQLEAIRSAVPATAGVAMARLEATRSLVTKALAEASRSVWEIPLATDAIGLERALREMLDRFGSEAPIELSVAHGAPGLPADTEYHIVRVAQEAVANAVRHAGGSRIRIEVDFPDGRILLRVADDGAGFDGAPASGHSGLLGMKQRASILKGEVRVRSARGEGTEVVLDVPSRVA
jgi:alpha-L-rhamnosidase